MQFKKYNPFALKAAPNSRLLLVCGIIISALCFSTFAASHLHLPVPGQYQQSQYAVSGSYAQKLIQPPFELPSERWEIEIADGDEKKKHAEFVPGYVGLAGLFAEHHYKTCLKSRLQQLNSSIYDRCDPPLFLLHHSWKCDYCA
jgi:hypothetical protein